MVELKTLAGMSSMSFPAQHLSCLSLKETSASLEHPLSIAYPRTTDESITPFWPGCKLVS